MASLLAACLGFSTRMATGLSCVLGLALIGFENSVAKALHTECLLFVSLFWLAFSHCGDALSVDALIKRKRSDRHALLVESRSRAGQYTWPVWLIRIQMTLIFCAAGMSKCRSSGLDWIFSDNLANVLVEAHFIPRRSDPLLPGLALWIAESRWMSRGIAAASVLLEVAAPLAIVSAPLRWPIAGGLFCMMSSFWILMGTPFPQMLVCWIGWIPFLKRQAPFVPTP